MHSRPAEEESTYVVAAMTAAGACVSTGTARPTGRTRITSSLSDIEMHLAPFPALLPATTCALVLAAGIVARRYGYPRGQRDRHRRGARIVEASSQFRLLRGALSAGLTDRVTLAG